MKGPTGRRGNTLPTRIKRLMQKDAEVGRIAAATPTLISRAMELFLRKLCTNLAESARGKKAKTVSPSHLKEYVENDEMMDFLKSLVKDVPSLSVESSSASKRSCPFNGEREKGSTKISKRQKTKRPRSISPKIGRPTSVFASMSQGSETCTVSPSQPSTLKLSRSEMKPKTTRGTAERVISLPVMSSAVRTNLTPVDPSSLPINLRNALNIPNNKSSDLSMPSSSNASVGHCEAMTCQEMDTPLSVFNLEFAKPMETDACTQCAEEDNYEFSDDES